MTTRAQAFIDSEMRKMLGPGKPYRAGALLLTYPPEKPGMTCRIAMGAGIGEASFEHVMDFVQLVKGLRRLADELEKRIAGEVPLSQEIVDDAEPREAVAAERAAEDATPRGIDQALGKMGGRSDGQEG